MTPAAQRNRRALLLLGVAVALYVGTSQFALPWYDSLKAAPAEAADNAEQLRKYRRELAHRGAYETLTSDIRKKVTDSRQYFFGTDTGELQKIVEESARSVGIDLAQRSATQSKKLDDMLFEITMTTTFESTPGQLVRFLEVLRSSPKVVNVKQAQIDPIQPAFEAPKTGELKKSVRVNLTISGEGLFPAATAAAPAAGDKVK
jgi:hypothetical protein